MTEMLSFNFILPLRRVSKAAFVFLPAGPTADGHRAPGGGPESTRRPRPLLPVLCSEMGIGGLMQACLLCRDGRRLPLFFMS